MAAHSDIPVSSADNRADRIMEMRNKAFRVLYDTVIEVEGATEEQVYSVLCRNLHRLAEGLRATLVSYNSKRNMLKLEAEIRSDAPSCLPGELASAALVEVAPEMMERFTTRQVRSCTKHGRCPVEILRDASFQDSREEEDGICYCLSSIQGNELIALGKVMLSGNEKLKMKDIVDTYMHLAGVILQRVHAVRDLRESEEKYRDVVERANDGIVIIQEGHLAYANPSICSIMGFDLQKIVGRPFWDFLHPDEVDLIKDRHQRRMNGEESAEVYETALQDSHGARTDVELNVGLISYGGKPAELVIVRGHKRTQEGRGGVGADAPTPG